MTIEEIINEIIKVEGGYSNDPSVLKAKIDLALLNAAKVDEGEGSCSVQGCPFDKVAKGFCNAHYIRQLSGRDMSLPIRNRKSGNKCTDCGKDLKGKGGWNLCTSHFKKERIKIIKDVCIEHFGGSCCICKGSFHRRVYDFHHLSGKDNNPSFAMANLSVEKIANEISKCIMVCANCHRLIHAEADNDD